MTHEGRRAVTLLFAAAATFAALPALVGAQESAPRPTPTPVRCAHPNIAAATLRAVEPATPPLAEQQGIQGTVLVVVSLDEYSNVVAARIQASPSVLLNQAALDAARASTFQTEIRDCRPLAADYIFAVGFQASVTYGTTASGERTVSVLGEGTVMRRADLAYVQADIITRGDDDPLAALNDAAFAALNAKLAALGTTARTIRDPMRTRSNDYYATSRTVEIAVDNVANIDRTVAVASSAPSVVVTSIRFSLHNSAPAQSEALTLALRDAEARARNVVTAPHLGNVQRVAVPPNDRARPPLAVVPYRLTPVVGGFTQPAVRVPEIGICAIATVTYLIKP